MNLQPNTSVPLPAKARHRLLSPDALNALAPLLVFCAMLVVVALLNSNYLKPMGISVVTATAAPILLIALGQAMVLNIGSKAL